MRMFAAVCLALLCGCGAKQDPIDEIQKLGGVVVVGDNGSPVAASFKDVDITDKDVAWVSRLPTVRTVTFDGVNISDNALIHLRSLKTLKELLVSNAPVTGVGILSLSGLENVILYNIPVGDDFLDKIKDLKSLKLLFVYKSRVTQEGEDAFRKARPEVSFTVGHKD